MSQERHVTSTEAFNLRRDVVAAEAENDRLRGSIAELADAFAARGIVAPTRGQPSLVGAAYIKASADLRALLDQDTRA